MEDRQLAEGIDGARNAVYNEQMYIDLGVIAITLQRIADVVAPAPNDKVDTQYVAAKLGLKTTTRVAQMAVNGDIPKSCIVQGTGQGKVWKFHRKPIDQWIISRK